MYVMFRLSVPSDAFVAAATGVAQVHRPRTLLRRAKFLQPSLKASLTMPSASCGPLPPLLPSPFALAVPLAVLGDVTVAPGGGTPGTLQNFQLVGHNDLFARGMNAAPALYDHYVYVGNRTDGSLSCSETGGVQPCHASANVHIHPGVLIVDVADPSDPTVVGELGPPYAALPGITTRELRVWPEKKLLMIMTFRCSSAIHDCPPGTDATFPFDIKFFDLSDPVHPAFISSYVPT